jgi:hypothetical protein
MNRVKQFVRNWYKPSWWFEHPIPFVFDRSELEQRYYSRFSTGGCDVMSEEWDNLLIVDACRADMFERQNTIPGELSTRRSRGSSTPEFLEENFAGERYHDTVYVTANPIHRVDRWCRADLDSVFHAVEDVWMDAWEEETNTVLPDAVTEAVLEAQDRYPNKRLIGHFIQPHQPFVGDVGRRITQSGMRGRDAALGNGVDPGRNIWERLKQGEVSKEVVWEAYCENLDVVLPHIEELCETLPGKTVVTSDHGNLVGEFAWPFPVVRFGHPEGIHTERLVTVPWLEPESASRREVEAETPGQTESAVDPDDPHERLRSLGYL